MSFQENLKYYREKAGYKTAKDFSEALSLPYATYAAYENKNREPKYNTLCKIADLLHVSTDELLGRENNILGTNEDERLKKELDEILTMPTKFLKLQSINDDYMTFEICEKDENYIWHASFLKKDIIEMINKTKNTYIGMSNAEIYKNLILNAISKAINDRQSAIEYSKKKIQKLEENNPPQKELKIFEETQMINSDLETLNKLQKLKETMGTLYKFSHPIMDAITKMLISFQQNNQDNK